MPSQWAARKKKDMTEDQLELFREVSASVHAIHEESRDVLEFFQKLATERAVWAYPRVRDDDGLVSLSWWHRGLLCKSSDIGPKWGVRKWKNTSHLLFDVDLSLLQKWRVHVHELIAEVYATDTPPRDCEEVFALDFDFATTETLPFHIPPGQFPSDRNTPPPTSASNETAPTTPQGDTSKEEHIHVAVERVEMARIGALTHFHRDTYPNIHAFALAACERWLETRSAHSGRFAYLVPSDEQQGYDLLLPQALVAQLRAQAAADRQEVETLVFNALVRAVEHLEEESPLRLVVGLGEAR